MRECIEGPGERDLATALGQEGQRGMGHWHLIPLALGTQAVSLSINEVFVMIEEKMRYCPVIGLFRVNDCDLRNYIQSKQTQHVLASVFKYAFTLPFLETEILAVTTYNGCSSQ